MGGPVAGRSGSWVARSHSIPLNLTLLKGCSMVGVFCGDHTNRNPGGRCREMVAELLAMLADGRIGSVGERHVPARSVSSGALES